MNTPRTIIPIVAALLISSCGEDSELVKQHGEQEAELAKLRGELALVQERIKHVPTDQSAELKEAQEKRAKLEAELKALDTEIASLEEDKNKLEQEYEAYQRRYVVR